LGGGISPGIELRFKALNDHTAKLPLLQIDNAFQKLIGETTHESILSGVLNGAVAEIDGIISSYQLIYPDLITVLTGGNGDFFAKRLKSSIFGHPNLVLKGLNQLLEFQLEKK
jgi:type III pantothenate kinase